MLDGQCCMLHEVWPILDGQSCMRLADDWEAMLSALKGHGRAQRDTAAL